VNPIVDGDLGWDDSDGSVAAAVVGAALVFASTAVYMGAVWLARGLPPICSLAAHRQRTAERVRLKRDT
jgi:hypothetical protein